MKKIIGLGITLTLLSILIGCVEPEGKPQTMVFVDNVMNQNVQFTIDENLRFNVKFITLDTVEHLGLPGMVVGVEVLGRVRNTTNKWTDSTITGLAQNMSAKGSSTLDEIVAAINVGIELAYSKDNGVIADVSVAFTGYNCTFDPNDPLNCDAPLDCDQEKCFLAKASQAMMGGTYIRIK